jgi:uncharacterized OB-fold protein
MRTTIKPRVTLETEGFWEGCREHELRAQSCDDCGHLRFPPQPMCPQCHSFARSWKAIAGRGKVYTFSVVTGEGPEPPLPGAHGFPYGVVLVELDAGVRMLTDADTEVLGKLKMGAPMEVLFERIDDEITLPRFVPASNGAT